jgi:hypothetical protein
MQILDQRCCGSLCTPTVSLARTVRWFAKVLTKGAWSYLMTNTIASSSMLEAHTGSAAYSLRASISSWQLTVMRLAGHPTILYRSQSSGKLIRPPCAELIVDGGTLMRWR